MKVQLFGAARTVTGSCYVVEACGARFTIDCGMHQGNKAIEERNLHTEMYRPSEIDFIVLTHAHIDHSGLLPRMVRDGFKNPIYCTEATSELVEILLEDSAHIQEMEALWRAQKYSRRGKKSPPPAMYSVEDARNTVQYLRSVNYHESFEPHPGIKVTLYDAGHILGSAFVLLEVTENGKTTKVIFSGDLGRPHSLIVRDPELPVAADYVFMESTYGDRDHNNEIGAADELAEAIAYSYAKGEKVIIPAFAVERTQEILYCLHNLAKQGKLPDDLPIFVDSPLAIRATEIFSRHQELYDEETVALLAQGEDPFQLPNLRYTMQADESRMINDMTGSAIVISASGMCNAGRIKHHLRHNLWRPGASIVFVGYQGVGTPGRKIVEKATSISLFGDDVPVAARIFTIGGFSAHAGQSQLMQWLTPVAKPGTQIVLIHGEEKAQSTLAELIKERFGLTAIIPGHMEELELAVGVATVTTKHEELAHPRVDWEFLTEDTENKWRRFKEKLNTVDKRPWVEQTELREYMERLNYELTRVISGM